MIGPITITQKQVENNLEFILTLTDTQGICWKILHEDQGVSMIVPVKKVFPIPDDVKSQVEEFQKQFMEDKK